jgi:uncharacterized DUF497 family protein
MNITHIIWLTRFVDKIESKHGVSTDEVEEMLTNHPRIQRIERGVLEDEDLYRATGQTEAGRFLVVFFIYKGRGRALVISARDVSQRERKNYAKRKK